MKYQLNEKKSGKITVDFELDAKEWEAEVENAYQKEKGKYKKEGFRQGKVPRKVLENTYGDSLFYEDAFNYAFPKYYVQMLKKETQIDPVDYPALEVKKISKDGVKFSAIITLMPEITLGEYKNIEIAKTKSKVTEAEIKSKLEATRQQHARFVEVTDRPIKNGDLVNLNYSGSVNGVQFDGGTAKDQELEIGSKSFIEGFEDQMIGMNIGDKRDLNVTFPKEYHAKDLAGKPAIFAVEVLGIREKHIPELDDAFAKDTSEFATIAELTADAKKKLQEQKEQQSEIEAENKLVSKIIDNAKVEVPEVLIEKQLDNIVQEMEYRMSYQGFKFDDYLKYTNQTMEGFRKDRHEEAKKNVKTSLVLEEIVRTEKLLVTDEELDKKLDEIEASSPKKQKNFKKTIPAEQINAIRNSILNEKLLKFLKSKNKIS